MFINSFGAVIGLSEWSKKSLFIHLVGKIIEGKVAENNSFLALSSLFELNNIPTRKNVHEFIHVYSGNYSLILTTNTSVISIF